MKMSLGISEHGASLDMTRTIKESSKEQDIVFWYVAHLPHMAALGPTKWLALGPILRVQRE
ncbi:MAG: hypothetical protein OJF51_000299 [Nitrospira sp.]|jgi:hypothetical protein|nr:MAG: hypothetical protein OJF51_000299 [Nitrospira sp.]